MATPITCRSCRHHNDPWRKHCGGCGSGLPGACATCGSVNGPAEKFCGGCAKRLRAAPVTQATPDHTIPIDVITDLEP